jgi:hypothetical protein
MPGGKEPWNSCGRAGAVEHLVGTLTWVPGAVLHRRSGHRNVAGYLILLPLLVIMFGNGAITTVRKTRSRDRRNIFFRRLRVRFGRE